MQHYFQKLILISIQDFREIRIFENRSQFMSQTSEEPCFDSLIQNFGNKINFILLYLKTPLSGFLGTLFYQCKMRLETNKF